MINILSTNIISSLGFSSQENYQAVKNGKIGLKHYENAFDIPEPIVASLIGKEKLNTEFYYLPHSEKKQYTKLEKAAILSVYYALSDTQIDPSDDDVLFIFSTTKGNIELLKKNELYEPERIYLWRSAALIAEYFGNKNQTLVVSNACISGIAAQIAAARCLYARRAKYVIVVGAEVLSKFIISGFQSFKALSNQVCKPFDKNRNGLNLGEAAATIIYTFENKQNSIPKGSIIYENGVICIDANHISGPSRTGEGLFDAIIKVMKNKDIEDVGFINAHGTATPYNDEMEAIAIGRCGLENIPVNSLKGYFGHTLGAAGVLEIIISAHALQDNIILNSQGFDELGVIPININTKITTSLKPSCLKLISGFGGCNAAIQLRIKN
jgi:3-oxoacyl-[acyl-carrier-protein] synthase-1